MYLNRCILLVLYYKNGNQEQFLLDGTSLFYGKWITFYLYGIIKAVFRKLQRTTSYHFPCTSAAHGKMYSKRTPNVDGGTERHCESIEYRAKDTKTRRMMVLNGTGLFFLTPVSPVPLYQTSFLTSINQSSDHQFIIKATSLLNPVPIDPVLASFSNQGVYHARWVEIWGLRPNTEYTRLVIRYLTRKGNHGVITTREGEVEYTSGIIIITKKNMPSGYACG
ncbi:conserved hypothetical protein [Trichinella spiralis]|uniref:hypothetical protein n=1 Tax=Trichinella spiralis TaxID=6334 RepID=UPI0001EFE782|nr:conserved hypothetical protein [Trichinella spiralis]